MTTAAYLRTALEAAGICPQQVVKNRATGTFVVRFQAADVKDMAGVGTDKAATWAKRIEQAIDGAQVVNHYESIATWRPTEPVLFAEVVVKLGALPVALGSDAGGDIGTGWVDAVRFE